MLYRWVGRGKTEGRGWLRLGSRGQLPGRLMDCIAPGMPGVERNHRNPFISHKILISGDFSSFQHFQRLFVNFSNSSTFVFIFCIFGDSESFFVILCISGAFPVNLLIYVFSGPLSSLGSRGPSRAPPDLHTAKNAKSE